jgi:hypothetical protein
LEIGGDIGLFGEPVGVIVAFKPMGDGGAAVFLRDDWVAGVADPDERVRVARLEEVLRDIAVSDLGEEPVGDRAMPPTIAELLVDGKFDVGWKRQEIISYSGDRDFHFIRSFPAGSVLGNRKRRECSCTRSHPLGSAFGSPTFVGAASRRSQRLGLEGLEAFLLRGDVVHEEVVALAHSCLEAFFEGPNAG